MQTELKSKQAKNFFLHCTISLNKSEPVLNVIVRGENILAHMVRSLRYPGRRRKQDHILVHAWTKVGIEFGSFRLPLHWRSTSISKSSLWCNLLLGRRTVHQKNCIRNSDCSLGSSYTNCKYDKGTPSNTRLRLTEGKAVAQVAILPFREPQWENRKRMRGPIKGGLTLQSCTSDFWMSRMMQSDHSDLVRCCTLDFDW